jgi:hypothetical protein
MLEAGQHAAVVDAVLELVGLVGAVRLVRVIGPLRVDDQDAGPAAEVELLQTARRHGALVTDSLPHPTLLD